ncbi:MAG: transposase [Crocosphaera sp.]
MTEPPVDIVVYVNKSCQVLSMNNYRTNPHSVTLLNYHFVWCPKRRKPVLTGEIKYRAQSIIFDLCKENQSCAVVGCKGKRTKTNTGG